MAVEKIRFRKQRRTRSFVSLESLADDEVGTNTIIKESEREDSEESIQSLNSPYRELNAIYIL